MDLVKYMLVCMGCLSLSMQLTDAEKWQNDTLKDKPEHPFRRSERSVSLSSIRSKLTNVLQTNDVPDELIKVVSALDTAIIIFNCLPINKTGNCYRANDYCEIDTKDFTIRARLTICKNPWSLRLDFQLPKEIKRKIPGILRPITFIDVAPIILTLQHNTADGVTSLVSNSRIATGGLNLFGLKFNAVKAYFKFNLFVRWDCTKPSLTSKRLEYNTGYDDNRPGSDLNKLYFKLNIRYEIKTKRFPCFCYKCKKCEDILSKQGHFAEGPESCKEGCDHNSIVSCSSQKYRHSRCPVSGAGQITSVFVQKKESKSACARGSSYGVEGGSIWVNRGCRARFFVCHKLGRHKDVYCKSLSYRLARCHVTGIPATGMITGMYVQRRDSRSGCNINSSYGYSRDTIWVSRGCRALFKVYYVTNQ